MENRANLFQPIYATSVGAPPVVIRAVVTTNNNYVVGGMPEAQLKAETYVMLSALPKELQERVKTSIQAIISGM